MSVKKFKFVSPGVFINEIDNSQLSSTPAPEGPTIVGRSLRGPAMRPVQVESFEEFVNVFGPPIAGTENVDAFRNPAFGAATYGGFAAQAWLRNSSTINFVRMIGFQDPNATSGEGEAGWRSAEFTTSGGGAYGLFVFNSSSAADHTGTLAAIFYCDADTYVELSGTVAGTSITQEAACVLVGAVNNELTVRVVQGGGSTIETACNFDRTSRKYVRSIFNTNPTKTNSTVTPNADLVEYFVGETYDRGIQEDLGGASNIAYGMMIPLDAGSTADGADFRKGFVNSTAGWVISQDKLGNSASFDATSAARTTKLFRFVGLQTGQYDQGAIKISIENIRPSRDADDFGQFNVVLRRMNDNDAKIQEVERYNSVTLNPNSPNYIAAQIGDKRVSWNNDERVYKEYGQYDNNSRYIRMQMGQVVNDGQIAKTLLPFGYYGPTKFVDVTYTSGSTLPGTAFLVGTASLPAGAKPSIGTDNDFTSSLEGSTAKAFKISGYDAGAWNAGTGATSRQTFFSITLPAGYAGDDAGTFYIQVTGTLGTPAANTAHISGSGADLNSNIAELVSASVAVINSGAAVANTSSVGSGFDTLKTYITASSDTIGEVDLFATLTGTAGNLIIGSGSSASFTNTSTGNVYFTGGVSDAGDLASGDATTLLIKFPKVPVRTTTAVGAVSSPQAANFGLTTTRSSGSTTYDDSIPDFLRTKPAGISDFSIGDYTDWSHVFTMDDLVVSAGNLLYTSGSRQGGTSLTAKSGSYAVLTGTVAPKGFTIPLYGGFDGLNITEKDPFANKNLSNKTERTGYAFHSLMVALDSMKDREVVQTNVLTAPAITNTSITDKILDIAEDRGDCIGIIDLAGGFQPPSETTNTFENRVGSVTTTINQLNARSLNTSFGCAFYPWVRIRDTFSDSTVWMPPSVPALGAFSFTDRSSEPWFAPAGFTRGGLSKGAGGVQVLGVADRLRAKDRDDLYERNVNPIGTFPNEGVVILGQKTLQVTPSALDRINVRRLLIYTKRHITHVANNLLFEQNVQDTWNKFIAKADPILRDIKAGFGLEDYKLILDETTTTPELRDRNIMYAKVFLKPAKSIEFIALDFVITNSAATFE